MAIKCWAPAREQLLDVKRIHVNPANYPNNQNDALGPVKNREQKVHNEYVQKLRKLDQKYGGVHEGDCGPMEAQLRTYPPVRGLAFGAFGEAGPNVKALVNAAAEAGISAVIQPGGSMRDEEVIQAADEHGMAMLFTGVRHFRH